MVYTDYEKTLDHVDHDLLLRKLLEYGVRGKLLKSAEIISNQSSITCQSQMSLFRLRQRNKWCPPRLYYLQSTLPNLYY